MSSLRVVTLGLVVALAAGCAVEPAPREVPPAPVPAPEREPLTGAWVLTVESPMGTRDSDAIFTQAGERLSGRIIGPHGEEPLSGTLEGDAIRFGMRIQVQGQAVEIDYAGTVEGHTMSGTVQFGAFGAGTFTGRRK